jgi:hypothetical protein
MLETQEIQNNTAIWHQLINQERDYLITRQTFLNSYTDKVNLFKNALQNPTERTTALHLFTHLTLEERQSLFDDLIKLASVGHSDIELVRTVILSFDKFWLLNNIEKSAESILNNGTDEEYRRLLELYINIDQDLTKRLVKQALETDDPDIYEVGEDFHNYLKNR